jgi:ATP-binding cassette subfamily F protein uup
LQLLLVLASQPNVLLLDEPTNDLDLDTLRTLEEFLDDWSGSLIVVSHDRTFLDRTTEELLSLDGSGDAQLVRGGVEAWLASRRQAAASRPATPSTAKATVPGPAKPRSAKTPSTLRRQLSAAERKVAEATARLDKLSIELGRTTDHVEMSRIGKDLEVANASLSSAEEAWLELAEEAEEIGLTVD